MQSRILWYTQEFIVDSMTAKCPGPVVALVKKVIFTNLALYIVAKCIQFGFVCPKDIVPEGLGVSDLSSAMPYFT